MKLRYASLIVRLFACGAIGVIPAARAAEPGQPATTAISKEASTALQQMGKTLSAKNFSFKVRTIRVYQDADGQPLHIFHTLKVVARRPDRLSVHATGDDGSTELLYDGKTAVVFGVDKNKYASIAAPKTIEAMLADVSRGLGVDFPLADFLDRAPAKAFLTGVTTGKEVNTVTLDGIPCRHLFFTQTPGIELELWVDKNNQAVPRRLIVTYRMLPGQPNFIAEFSDWNFTAHPADSEFVFQPPAGATQVELKPVGSGSSEGGK